MVDVVYRADAVLKVDIGGYGCHDIVHGDVLVVELFNYGLDCLALVLVKLGFVGGKQRVEQLAGCNELYARLLSLFPVLLLFGLFVLNLVHFLNVVDGVDSVRILGGNGLYGLRAAFLRKLLHEAEVGIIYGGQQTEHLGVLVRNCLEVYGVVGYNLVSDFAALGVGNEYEHFVHARVLNGYRLLFGDNFAGLCHDFARFGVEYVVGELAAGQTVSKVELFVELIPAHLYNVVPSGVEEEVVEVLAYGCLGGNFAGTQPSVQFYKTIGFGLGGILFDGVLYHFFVGEEVEQRSVGTEAEGTQKDGNADFALPVHVYPENALGILFKFEPCAAVGDDGGAEHLLARLVARGCVVYAGRTHELGYYYALRAVYDEGTAVRHQRELAHEYGLVDNLVLDFVYEPHRNVKGKRVSSVAVAALLFVILRLFVEPVIEEIELVVVRVVGYGREIFKNFGYAFVYEGGIARFLNFNEVGNVDDFVYLAEFSSFRFAVLVNR